MGLAQTVIDEATARRWENYALSQRDDRFGDERNSDWKARIEVYDKLYGGDFSGVFDDEMDPEELPKVMNLVQVGSDDLARLASESPPTVRCDPAGNSIRADENAQVREAILETYSQVNNLDSLSEQTALDLAASGFAASLAWFDGDRNGRAIGGYPRVWRLDPRGSYPTIYNGELVDLMQMSRMPVRTAEALFPGMSFPTAANEVEILDFYTKNEITKVLVPYWNDSVAADPTVLQYVKHNLGKVPVGATWLTTADGKFRGLFDQITGSLKSKNVIATLMIEYARQMVYAPFFENDVENANEVPGPNTIYHGNSDNARMERVAPAGSQPELFNLLGYMDDQQRGGIFYPAGRQGEISQSIASASFVNSTLGALTTLVRHILKKAGAQRKALNEVMLMVDEKFIGGEQKGLMVPRGPKKVYTPINDIAGKYGNRVILGAGAGLDTLNKRTAYIQDMTAKISSVQTVREQSDYIVDPLEEERRVEKEQSRDIFLQRAFTEGTLDFTMRVNVKMNKGLDFMKAAAEVYEEQAEEAKAAAQAAVPAAAEGVPSPEGGLGAAEQQLALEKGATAPEAFEPDFNPDPLQQVFVGN